MKYEKPIRASLVVAFFAVVGAGCASTSNIPLAIQSEPLGAHVLYQARGVGSGDWVYLGNTPVEVNRQISHSNLRNADAFVVRVVKDGYNDQMREWSGEAFTQEVEEQGRVFWNPRMIKSE